MLLTKTTLISRAAMLLGRRSFSTRNGFLRILRKDSSDVVITLALRTPKCRAEKGALSSVTLDELLLGMLKAVKEMMVWRPARLRVSLWVGSLLLFLPSFLSSQRSILVGPHRRMSPSPTSLRGPCSLPSCRIPPTNTYPNYQQTVFL